MVPFKGMFVADMTVEELDEIYEIRLHLECAAVEKAVSAVSEQELKNLMERLKRRRSASTKEIER
ncbi:hypothetical protein [Paenibacillus spongiae]|uniref:Uncharacterized protein n=1 Tax=Paenibacillus spongiae TaxID=2909671 RepID=A0ABY5S0H7_9BACL|nr:hypothetical protein [Paenibacillus spongiae]UVI27347.1 hypothetical protein L1F29_17880 [Paenibacillus spongiae]